MTQVNPKTYAPVATQKVAFLGLGVMGYPMAAHLALAGHTVTVYNRNTVKSEQWLQQFGQAGTGGHTRALTPREAVAQADIVFCCVGNDDDLRSVVLGALQKNGERTGDGALAGMRAGSLFVDHTTASAQVARELHAMAQLQGVDFVDAPVSGRPRSSTSTTVAVICGASPKPTPSTTMTTRYRGTPWKPLMTCNRVVTWHWA